MWVGVHVGGGRWCGGSLGFVLSVGGGGGITGLAAWVAGEPAHTSAEAVRLWERESSGEDLFGGVTVGIFVEPWALWCERDGQGEGALLLVGGGSGGILCGGAA